MTPGRLVPWVLLLAVALAPTLEAGNRYNSGLRFRTLRTAHFTVYFHQGEDMHARRLALVAEEVRAHLQGTLKLNAPRHAHVILVDQTDVSNGWSSPLPYDVIEVTLAPPSPGSALGYHDDWLRMVFTHEYAHTMHLDQVGGVMKPARWLLGRHPLSFPNLFVPEWQIEGVATYAESLDGRGRVHAPQVRAMTGALARGGRTPALDQIGGGLDAWPRGLTSYVYGGLFLDNAATRAGGPEAVGALARATARRVPFFGGGAFRGIFGQDTRRAWRTFTTASLPTAAATDGGPRRLTHHGYATTAPRFTREASTPPDVWYATNTAHDFPAVRRVGLDGTHDTQVASRVLGGSTTFWRDWTVFDQVEYGAPSVVLSDLWAVGGGTGRTIRLSRGARLSDPDVAPDGRFLVAARAADGQRDLVVFAIHQSADHAPALAAEASARLRVPGCAFASPRWAPDGAHIAATIHCVGELPDIVVYDAALQVGRRVAPSPSTHEVTPAWTPDGQWLIFASDRGAQHHRLLATPATDTSAEPAVVLALDAPGGATQPDVSPDGRTLAFVSETAAGADVFVSALPNLGEAVRVAPAPPGSAAAPSGAPDTTAATNGYAPWGTLWPRAWQPLAEISDNMVRLGGSVGGADVLGRHTYQVTALWAHDQPAIASGWPAAPKLDWYASYSYDRWRPTLLVSASAESETVAVRAGDVTLTAAARTTGAFAGLWYQVRRMRWSQAILAGVLFDRQRILLPLDVDLTRNRHAFRGGWSFSSARQYGYSISREHGLAAGVTVEHVTPSLGADGTATSGAADLRLYLPAGVRHGVLALRAAAGGARGDATVRRRFGNDAVGAPASMLSFDNNRVAFVRGLPSASITGHTVAGVNADLRLPLLRIERGVGTWPLFVNRLHGALFVDVASAGERWESLDQRVWATGGELAATVTVAYGLRLTVAAGAAWTHDPARLDKPNRAAGFVRTGYAF